MAEPTAKVVSLDLNDDTDASLAEAVATKVTTADPAQEAENNDVDEAGSVALGLRPGQDTAELLVEQSDPNSPLYSVKSFEELGLLPELLKGIYALKFNKPSRIQENAIPNIIADPPKNFIGQAQSGTGKTAAYSLSMLARVDPNVKLPQALCLCPSRELARQVHSVVSGLARFTTIQCFLALPGVKVERTIAAQVVVGTPGTINEHITRRRLDTKNIKIFVLDEADQMIQRQGLGPQSLGIKAKLPRTCQFCLFSATYADDVAAFAQKIVANPKVTIRLKPEELSLEKIKQLFIECKDYKDKIRILSEIFGFISVGSTIIFAHTKKSCIDIHAQMRKEGHQVAMLHGDMELEDRDRVLDEFKSNKIRLLVTTNLLARGIDILQISLVINFDLPLTGSGEADPENYLHRIGRSGRFGRAGIAINMVDTPKSKADLKAIERHFKKQCTEFKEADLEKLGKMLEDIQ